MPKGYVEDVLESKNNSTYLKPYPLTYIRRIEGRIFTIPLTFFSGVCPRGMLKMS